MEDTVVVITNQDEYFLDQNLRLINESGENVGILKGSEAVKKAENVGLSLIVADTKADPIVCKIIDLGNYKYNLKKKNSKIRQLTKVQTKEVKFRPNIEEHDYQVKIKQVKKFLSKNHRVKITCFFRGREFMYKDASKNMFERIKDDVGGTVEQESKLEGKNMSMIIKPKGVQ